MKNSKNKIPWTCGLLLLVLFFCSGLVQAQSSEVGMTVVIPEHEMNLFIMEQYNKVGFLDEINGSQSGVNYNVILEVPYVELNDDNARVYWKFIIESNVYNGNFEFDDHLVFEIPSVEDLSVKGVSEAFNSKVDGSGLHEVLKMVIKAAWSSLKLEAYPEKLAKSVDDSEYMVEVPISIEEPYFSVGFDVDQGALSISLGTYVEVREYYNANIHKESGTWHLAIVAGSQVEIKEFNIYSTNGGLRVQGINTGVVPKRGKLDISMPGVNLSENTIYIGKILFKTSNTFYVRGYKLNSLYWPGYVVPHKVLN